MNLLFRRPATRRTILAGLVAWGAGAARMAAAQAATEPVLIGVSGAAHRPICPVRRAVEEGVRSGTR
jgi:hypothetical protein